MKIKIVVIGKTDDTYLIEGIEKYLTRLKHYVPTILQVIPDLKNNRKMTQEQQKEKEGETILLNVEKQDMLILLDEKGKQFSSRDFSSFLQKQMLSGLKNLVFAIGGPYGFSESVYKRANSKISLSPMTFSHQMVRLIFTEQLYRAMTILKGEPYHHD